MGESKAASFWGMDRTFASALRNWLRPSGKWSTSNHPVSESPLASRAIPTSLLHFPSKSVLENLSGKRSPDSHP
jgi:hypothetical protein